MGAERHLAVRREWELEDLIECWTLDEEDFRLIANKSGFTRLGFVLALKFFEQEARFPRRAGELPLAAVEVASSSWQTPFSHVRDKPGLIGPASRRIRNPPSARHHQSR